MNFHLFKSAVAAQFARMAKHQLFRTTQDKDALWALYLASFPEGSNPIYKTRTEHDCQCCKQFIRAVGNVVAVIDGKVESIWTVKVADAAFQTVANALDAHVASAPITDAFLHYENTAGTDRTLQDTLDGVKRWDHFFVNIPPHFVMPNKDIPTQLNDFRTAHDVFKRGLEELTDDALDTVLELISQNALYRGEEHKHAVTAFKKAKSEFAAVPLTERPGFIWSKALTPAVARFRNTAIGTLVTDLSEGKKLDDAVASFEAKVAPLNYKRPTAAVTKSMIEAAKKTIEELGFTSALSRRYATLHDITINNVLFADRSVHGVMAGDIFSELAASTPAMPKSLDKVQEVSIDKFLTDILPGAASLEIMVENRHTSNLVSLVAPVDPTAAQLFKWGNNFSWSYNGDAADSTKERVKAAGGSVVGDLCCRLAWDCKDDLDFHMYEPDGGHIYFSVRRQLSRNGGMLDVDANGIDALRDDPVENIFYADRARMKPGIYVLKVHQYNHREHSKGFDVEIECDGNVHRLHRKGILRTDQEIRVATIKFDGKQFDVIPDLPASVGGTVGRPVWGLTTQTFRPVSTVMLSPNHWDGQGVGNKHYFFMLQGCVNEGTARGFYNEFLKSDLDKHRKVIEMVGAKMKAEMAGEQLSGLGFSSTQRNHVLCRVSGSFSRLIKITF